MPANPDSNPPPPNIPDRVFPSPPNSPFCFSSALVTPAMSFMAFSFSFSASVPDFLPIIPSLIARTSAAIWPSVLDSPVASPASPAPAAPPTILPIVEAPRNGGILPTPPIPPIPPTPPLP